MVALIVARYGALRDGLSGLLSVMPEITVVSTTDDLDEALKFVLQHCPTVALLEFEKIDRVHLAKVELIKAACPQLKILAFVQSLEPDARIEESGVDAVLPHGAKAARITDTVAALIQTNNDDVV